MAELIEVAPAKMTAGEVPVMDVADVVALEQRIAAEGTSLLALMTRAGHTVAEVVRSLVPTAARVVVLAGSGNNGGDGWVAAEQLAQAEEYDVALITREAAVDIKAEPARTAALQAMEACEASAGATASESRMAAGASLSLYVSPDQEKVEHLLAEADVIVDAILGTGFAHSEVREPYAGWIAAANVAHAVGVRIIAADCPSGLNAQTGATAHECIHADETVTMLAVKPGLLQEEATPFVGRLLLAPLV